MSLAQEIKAAGAELGFDAIGVTDASPIGTQHAHRFSDWLDCGFAAGMRYMHRNLDKRIEPAKLLAGARSVIVVALNYKRPPPKTAVSAGRVALYAQYDDYHVFLKQKLRELAKRLLRGSGGEHRFKICVDSAPLAERALAARAGIGFVGRNHMLICPDLGPAVLLGEIVSTAELDPDRPLQMSCRDCRRCLDACPTEALRSDGRFDAARCISYLTIEHKSAIGSDLAPRIGDWVFGCDQCLTTCPHFEQAPPCRNGEFIWHGDRAGLDLQAISSMTTASFATAFAGSPLERTGLVRLQRNATVCRANAAGAVSRAQEDVG